MSPLKRRVALGAGLGLLAAPGVLRAQSKTCRLSMDWAFGGSSAFALTALKSGYFREEGIEARVTRGFGSGKVPVDIASGTYDMGFGDFSAMAKFAAENPNIGMLCVLMVFDGLPLVAVGKAGGPISKPKDLEGKRIAAPEGDAGRQMFPVFAEFAGIDAKTVQWISVSPELREPMLVRGQADAITGFISSTQFALKGLGLPVEKQVQLRYRDYGVPLYSNCVMTTRRYAEGNPDTVRGMVRALTRGVRAMVSDPAAAAVAVKEAEPLADLPLETERAALVVKEMIMTEHVKRDGLSAMQAARVATSVDILARVYGFPRKPSPDELYTDAFLPAAAERVMV